MMPGIQYKLHSNDPIGNNVSFEKTVAFSHVMVIINEIYPGKTELQIEQANHACLAKTKSPRSREQYIRFLVKELSGY